MAIKSSETVISYFNASESFFAHLKTINFPRQILQKSYALLWRIRGRPDELKKLENIVI